jgi:hypothetical protein
VFFAAIVDYPHGRRSRALRRQRGSRPAPILPEAWWDFSSLSAGEALSLGGNRFAHYGPSLH